MMSAHAPLCVENLDGVTRQKLLRLFKDRHPNFHKLLRLRNWWD